MEQPLAGAALHIGDAAAEHPQPLVDLLLGIGRQGELQRHLVDQAFPHPRRALHVAVFDLLLGFHCAGRWQASGWRQPQSEATVRGPALL